MTKKRKLNADIERYLARKAEEERKIPTEESRIKEYAGGLRRLFDGLQVRKLLKRESICSREVQLYYCSDEWECYVDNREVYRRKRAIYYGCDWGASDYVYERLFRLPGRQHWTEFARNTHPRDVKAELQHLEYIIRSMIQEDE